MESQKRIRVILLALVAGVLITIIKFSAYYITRSNAILTDALENIINIVAGTFAFYSIYLASRPKDNNHPYGHGKVEFFAVGFEGALISFAGISIIYKSVMSLIHPQGISMLMEGIGITVVAGLANFFLGRYLVNKGKELNSMTLEADGKHLLSDSYTSVGLVAGLLIIYFTGYYVLDSVFSIILGALILYGGYKLLRKSVSGLMDEVDLSLVEQIVDILQKHRKDQWIDIHNLRAQRYGADLHIDCHLTLPYYYDLNQMHDEVSSIEKLIAEKSRTQVELFIHVDPCIRECCHYCRVENCPVRAEAKRVDIKWEMDIVMRNAKHYNNGL